MNCGDDRLVGVRGKPRVHALRDGADGERQDRIAGIDEPSERDGGIAASVDCSTATGGLRDFGLEVAAELLSLLA